MLSDLTANETMVLSCFFFSIPIIPLLLSGVNCWESTFGWVGVCNVVHETTEFV